MTLVIIANVNYSALDLFNFYNVATCKANYIMNLHHSIDTSLTVAHTFRMFNSTGHKLIHIVQARYNTTTK